jgi:hypothetical protein
MRCHVSDDRTPPDVATPDGTIPYRFNFLTQRLIDQYCSGSFASLHYNRRHTRLESDAGALRPV